MNINDEMMMELLIKTKLLPPLIINSRWWFSPLCSATESSSSPSLAAVVQVLGWRRTRIDIDLQVLFCLTQIILRANQQIPLRNSDIIFRWTRTCSWRLWSTCECTTTTSSASLIAQDFMGSHRSRSAKLPCSAFRMEHLVIPMRINYA
jgi:hypothetical protein